MKNRVRNLLTGNPAAADEVRFARQLMWIFLCVAAVLAAGAGAYLLLRQEAARKDATLQMSAIADLKLHEIQSWREERLADAKFFAHARFVSQDVGRFLEQPNAETRAAVVSWLDLLKGGDRYYSARLFDGQFQRRLSLPETAVAPPPETLESLDSVAQNGQIVLSDLRRDPENGLPIMDLVFPVYADPGQRAGRPLAFILLKLDASRFLFPLVQHWPTPSRTAETLLVRREGDQVLYLNELRHRPGSALALRAPWNDPKLPSGRILRGEIQVLEGIDYRGVPVVAAGRLVEGTPWGMVAKVDRAEIYAPLRRQAVVAGLFLVVLLVAGALLIALVWRQRATQFLHRQLTLERERAALADRLAREQREANARLEASVTQKTQELREANTNLEAFAFSAAHDLRSPLRYVQGFSTLLLDDYGPRLDAEGRSMLERLGESADRMARLLNDLLEYSRISQAELQLESVSLQESVREVLALLAGEIRSRQAAVEVTDSMPRVLAHQATAVLLINNLVANGLKFVAPGVQPRLSIRAEKQDAQVRLWVEDNGVGIAAKDQERIFKPFERLHSKREYPGTGLGLAIVRKGAQRMGGGAGVESEPGRGSRFWIDFRPA